ncbi:hypothetical protein K439DRAFT_1615628 [Ramaria rubella]|nr:hypothetical protein K439DRAFT_1615628 [Ramaria rubella]
MSTSDLNGVTSKVTENGAYAAGYVSALVDTMSRLTALERRVRQEKGAAHDSAQMTSSPYIEEVKGSASDTLASIQRSVFQATSQTEQAADDFQAQASAQTNAAVSEGKEDVEVAKTTGVGYIDQAKALTGSAMTTAQGYVIAVGKQLGASQDSTRNPSESGPPSSWQSTASMALETSKYYLASGQEAVQPRLQVMHETAQPHVERAQAIIQPYVDAVAESSKPYVAKGRSTLFSALGSDVTDTDETKNV